MIREESSPLLEVRQLVVRYSIPGSRPFSPRLQVHAVEDVSFDLAPGEILGIVGESGSGKSSLGRAALGLIPIESGQIRWHGQPVDPAKEASLRPLRRETSIIFQDPLAALDPQMNVGALVGEPLDIAEPALSRLDHQSRVAGVLDRVGLGKIDLSRFPHEFSGGQCQRIGIARALILNPHMILCDEALSALDVSVQAQIVRLLAELQHSEGLALLFISHNLAVVRQLCDRVIVLYLGRTMEIASSRTLFGEPRHPYTKALLAAIPNPDPLIARRTSYSPMAGEIPSAIDPPKGCVFHTRCPHAVEVCRREVPALEDLGAGHHVACHRWREL